jgi:hypothetical protein
MPVWLMVVIVGSCFAVVMLGLAYAWSKWMTRDGAPED